MPKSLLGKWSIGLLLAMPVLFIIGMTLTSILYDATPASETIFDDFINRPLLAMTILAGMTSGITSFITGLVALFAKKDRSIAVYISIFFGTLLIVFLFGELLFEH